MRTRFLPALLCGLVPAAAFAADPVPEIEAGGVLYMHSIGLPKEARICDRQIPGYLAQFDPEFERWKERNREPMTRAEQAMRAASSGRGLPFDERIGKITDGAVARIEKLEGVDLEEFCRKRLEFVQGGAR